MPHAKPSSPRCWRISLRNGPTPSFHQHKSKQSSGPCTLMGRSWRRERASASPRLAPRHPHAVRHLYSFCSLKECCRIWSPCQRAEDRHQDPAIWRFDIRWDSQLVIDQVMKASSYHEPKMEAYCKEVRKLEDKFHGLELNHITRWYNEAAEELAKIASTQGTIPLHMFLRDLLEPSPADLGIGPGATTATLEPTDMVEVLLAVEEVMKVKQSSHRPS